MRSTPEELPGKIPPHNLEAERAVLGAILLEPGILPRAIELLTADEFYKDAYRKIYAAVVRLFERSEPADGLTVAEERKRAGELDEVGGQATLATLMEEATVATQFDAYAQIVRDRAQLREAIGAARKVVEEGFRDDGDVSPALARLAQLHAARSNGHRGGAGVGVEYLEPIDAFLAEEDPPTRVVFPDLLPCGVIMLLHGEPRARKSLTAFELAVSAATGTAPFGIERLRPAAPIRVLYVQEEDPRALTRPRLRRLAQDRCGDLVPDTLYVAIRRGVDLDDPVWVARLIEDLRRLDIRLLVLDAARRLSSKTDEGPTKVRELIGVLRSIVIAAGVTIVIVHHDVKPQREGQDQRRRGQRASGGDWFAGCECLVHVERVSERESLVFPQDYKFSGDPAPFTFACHVEDGLIARLVGTDLTTEGAERAGVRGKILDWLRANGPATKTAMKKAGLGRWETIEEALDALCRDGKVDAGPGRKAGSLRYFVAGESSPGSGDGSTDDGDD